MAASSAYTNFVKTGLDFAGYVLNICLTILQNLFGCSLLLITVLSIGFVYLTKLNKSVLSHNNKFSY